VKVKEQLNGLFDGGERLHSFLAGMFHLMGFNPYIWTILAKKMFDATPRGIRLSPEYPLG
jgi:hypothetical protein